MTVKDLIEQLSKYPANALTHVHTGEVAGIVILGQDGDNLGMIKASMYDRELPESEPPK